jgi:hypothetical protein
MFSESNVKSNRFKVRDLTVPIDNLGSVSGQVALDLSEAKKFRAAITNDTTFNILNESVADEFEISLIVEGSFTINWPSNITVETTTIEPYIETIYQFRKVGGVFQQTFYKAITANPYIPTTLNRLCLRSSSKTLACTFNCLHTEFFTACSCSVFSPGASQTCVCCAVALTGWCMAPSSLNYCARGLSSSSWSGTWAIAHSSRTLTGYCTSYPGNSCSIPCMRANILYNNNGTWVPITTTTRHIQCAAPFGQVYWCAEYAVGMNDTGRLYFFCLNFCCYPGIYGGACFALYWNCLCWANPTTPQANAELTSCCILCHYTCQPTPDCAWCYTLLGSSSSSINGNDFQSGYTFMHWKWVEQNTAAFTFAHGSPNDSPPNNLGACYNPRTWWLRDYPTRTCVCNVVLTGVPLTKALNAPYYIIYNDKAAGANHTLHLRCDCNSGTTSVPCLSTLATLVWCSTCCTNMSFPPAHWSGSVITCDGCYFITTFSPISCSLTCSWWCGCGVSTNSITTTPANCACVIIYCRCSGSGAFCTTPTILCGCSCCTDGWRYLGSEFGPGTDCGGAVYLEGTCSYTNGWLQNFIVCCNNGGSLSKHAICFNSANSCWMISTVSWSCVCGLAGGLTYTNCFKSNIGWTPIYHDMCATNAYWGVTYTSCGALYLIHCAMKGGGASTMASCFLIGSYDRCTISANMNLGAINPAFGFGSTSLSECLYSGRPYRVRCNA